MKGRRRYLSSDRAEARRTYATIRHPTRGRLGHDRIAANKQQHRRKYAGKRENKKRRTLSILVVEEPTEPRIIFIAHLCGATATAKFYNKQHLFAPTPNCSLASTNEDSGYSSKPVAQLLHFPDQSVPHVHAAITPRCQTPTPSTTTMMTTAAGARRGCPCCLALSASSRSDT